MLWSSSGGSPCRALHAWLMSHGWVYRCQWICHHDLTGHNLDLSVAGDPGPSQHIVRDAWRAWCLQHDAASSRRDADLDCLVTSAIFAGWIGMPLGSLLLLSLKPGRLALAVASRLQRSAAV